MLTIRHEQMRALDDYMRRSFERRLAAHLTGRYPDRAAALGEPGIAGHVLAAIESARTYAITAERDVVAYAELMLEHGEAFDEAGWAADVLGFAAVPGWLKVERLRAAAPAVPNAVPAGVPDADANADADT